MLLHALRLALIQRIWLLATEISDFSPRHGVTRPMLEAAILRLDIEPALRAAGGDLPGRAGSRRRVRLRRTRARRAAPTAYAREHAEIFAPMRRCSHLVREIATAITHEVGAFG